jgi:heme oxygenase (biliverdin-IX-beta and delta-forming)
MPQTLKRIREHTQELHSRLETVVPVLQPDFTRAQYASLLEDFYGYYSGIQGMLRGYPDMPQPFPDWLDDKRVKWLEADLTFLGYSHHDIARLPVCHEVPILRTPASLVGAAYVFEGSSLGGQIMSRHLQKTWGLRPGAGATFFSAYGPETRTRWAAFTTLLGAQAAGSNETEIIDAAVYTLHSVYVWLSRNDHQTAAKAKAIPGGSRTAPPVSEQACPGG